MRLPAPVIQVIAKKARRARGSGLFDTPASGLSKGRRAERRVPTRPHGRASVSVGRQTAAGATRLTPQATPSQRRASKITPRRLGVVQRLVGTPDDRFDRLTGAPLGQTDTTGLPVRDG